MRKILVVVDMQNDFIDGALGSKEAEQMVERCADKAREAEEAGDIVIFTRDTHGADYMESEEGKNLPVPHCIEGTKGWEIAPAFAGSAMISSRESFNPSEAATRSDTAVRMSRMLPLSSGWTRLVSTITAVLVAGSNSIIVPVYPECPTRRLLSKRLPAKPLRVR